MLSQAHENAQNQKKGNPRQYNQSLAIRSVRTSDFENIMDIENSCFPGDLAYTRRQMRYLLFKANSTTLVEETDGQITGYVTALFRNNSGIAGIETIGVSPKHRGKGTGKRLLEAAERKMLDRGASFCRLEVSMGNKAAISMYQKTGYGISEKIPDYYIFRHNGTRAAYRMEKKLAEKP
jgi:ribosomal-protein-alanine N-acetyltransferase